MAHQPEPADPSDGAVRGRNEVLLVGRVAAAAEERELPSGDRLVCWRLVVDRPPARAAAGLRRPTIDTLACVAWTPGLRRTALALRVGDLVEVQGGLRRRFWRAGAGAISRYEVEASNLRRLHRRSGARRPARAAPPLG